MFAIRIPYWKISATLVFAVGFALPALAQISPRRPLTPDDLFRLEELGQITLSPDGKWLAYVVRRPKATASTYMQQFLDGNDRGDIWLVEVGKGTPQNLTNGTADGSGYWAPIWSPDGQRLAMLSTKGGNVQLWALEKSAGQLKQLNHRGVDLWGPENPCVWLSNVQLVCPVLPEGQRPTAMTVGRRAAEKAMREWPKAWKGREPTVSVLESGIVVSLDKRPQGQLLLIDVLKESRQLITAASFRDLRLSPDKQRVAVLKQTGVLRPDPSRLLPFGKGDRIYQAAVVSNAGPLSLSNLPNVNDVLPGSVRWSPDGLALALIGQLLGKSHPQVFRCVMAGETCQPVTSEEIDPTAIAWAAKNVLLVLAKPAARDRAQKNRSDWWMIEPNGTRRNLTAKMRSAPAELVRETNGESFLGLVDGDLWRIRPDGIEAQNLTASFEPKISSILWPTKSAPELRGVRQVILGVRREALVDLYRLDLSSGQMTTLSKASEDATLAEFAPQSETAVFSAKAKTGTYLWLSRPAFEQFTVLVETNIFLRQIAQGEFKKLEYRSLDGQELKAWVILPVGYQEGKHYPLVAWVYAGSVAGDTPTSLANINQTLGLNLQLLVAHGYAVLLPSMPLKPSGEASDPYMELTKGVLPAIDKLIESGIADPKRLGVIGQSFGGYSTYGLVTQTNRFKAAVSLAGTADLISQYSLFDARIRYEEFAHEQLFFQAIAETGPTRMGNPPWKDEARYLRNSPLSYVERVETPLMIIQGDMDYVAMQQGEQFFTALYRQNKRAAFVRYWGEGHVLDSPANIRDMWHRMFAWFDEFLDISRDQKGNLLWDGDKVKSRNGSAPLKPEDFGRFNQMILRDSQSKRQSLQKSQ
jgi:dipeptidyl aminopeptidase/acylaminoacyl peptidase